MYIEDALTQIRRHEGWRDRAYWDRTGRDVEPDPHRGHVTIGYGFRIDRSGALPRDIADEWLRRIVIDLDDELIRHIRGYRDLPPRVRAILLDMGYNLGVGGLLGFRRMLAALAAGDYDRAADEMLDSRWARQVGRRAKRLAALMRRVRNA